MAKFRIINTKFWTDGYVLDQLNPIDKLLFLYLITNPYTDISGVYELPLKVMAVETGIDKENIEKVIIPRFMKDGKVLYQDGWIAIKNFHKHQSLNPKVQLGIEAGLKKAPKTLRVFMEGDSLSIDDDSLSHLNLNSNLNTNPKKSSEPQAALVAELIQSFEELNPNTKRLYGMPPQRKAAGRLIELHGLARAHKAVEYIVHHRDDRYCPSITTPAQLEDKWAQLEDYSLKKAGRSKTVFL